MGVHAAKYANMKYKVSIRQWYEVLESSPQVELDEDAFRSLKENPYTGNSEMEFLEYLSNLPDQQIPEGLDKTNEDAFWEIKGDDVQMENIFYSTEKGQYFFLKGPTCETKPA